MEKFDSELISQVIENYIGGMCVFTYQSDTEEVEYLYINDGFFRMLSVSKPAGMMLLNNIVRTVIPDDIPLLKQWVKDVIADNGSVESEIRFVTLDGQLSWVALRGNLYERKERKNTIVCTISDITEKKMIEEEFMNQYEFMNKLMDIGVNFDYNVRTDVCEVRAGKNWELSGNLLIDHYMERVSESGIHPDDQELYVERIRTAMKKPLQDAFEYRAVTPFTGRQDYRWLKCNIMSIMGKEGYVSHVLGMISDINDRKMEEIELKLRADIDSLTGLLNKGATTELITQKLDDMGENGKKGAMLIIDVDDFKNINDTFGHATGDEALSIVGKVLRKNFKGMDVVGRIGGDEFLILMGETKSVEDAVRMADKLQIEIKQECPKKDVRDMLSISIGIAGFPDSGSNYQKLFENADAALYVAKNSGKAMSRVFEA